MYIKKLIETLRPFGDVLEVGFSAASEQIQKYLPKSHVLISADEKAVLWAKNHPTVKVINDTWQGALPSLGVFDTIFFGIDPIEHSFITELRYKEKDLDAFCKNVTDKKALSRFVAELEENGQIDLSLKEKLIDKYQLTVEKLPPAKRSNQMVQFLKQCVELHMRKGSRFSCFLKYDLDDPQFFSEIVVNPSLDCHEDGRILVVEKAV